MTVAHIDSQSTYTAIYATSLPRPEKHKVVNLLSIEGVTIPWPEGMTAAEALIEWKSQRPGRTRHG